MAYAIKVLNESVLIKEDPHEPYNKYKNYEHIIVPDKYEHGPEDRPVTGRVIAKSEDCKVKELSVGDRIIVGKWAGARFSSKGENYLLVRDYDVLAVIDG